MLKVRNIHLKENCTLKQIKVEISRKLFCIFFLSSICFNSYSQVTEKPGDLQIIGNPGVVFPPSPDAAALGKYGQYPVNLSNGLVNIDIPIFTIKLPKFQMPISVSYHPSGIKVDEVSSCVGLGWALNAGGVITRSVKGLPDNNFGKNSIVIHNKNYYDNLSGNSMFDLLHAQSLNEIKGLVDNESDVYYYNVNGLTGSFRFDINGNLIQIPLTNNVITYDHDRDCFRLSANDGTIYFFNEKETSSIGGRNGVNSPWQTYTSSWYLTAIRTVDCPIPQSPGDYPNDDYSNISFGYKPDNNLYEEDYENFQIKEYNIPCSVGVLPINDINLQLHPFVESRPTSAVQIIETKLLQTITYDGYSVNFVFKPDRIDRRQNRLDNIVVKNTKSDVLAGANFYQTYFTPTGSTSKESVAANTDYTHHYDYRLKLDWVILIGSYLAPKKNYHLEYNMDKLLPKYYQLNVFPDENKSYFGQDYWGYSNGVNTNQSFLTCKPSSYNIQPQADRNVITAAAQACMLNKITYPTGGYSKFTYESNNSGDGSLAGGLRIQSIASYDAIHPDPVLKSYKYEQPQNNYYSIEDIKGKVYSQAQDHDVFNEEMWIIEKPMFNYYLSEPNISSSFANGSAVYYDKVTEFNGNENGNIGKRELYYKDSDKKDVQYHDQVVPPFRTAWYPYRVYSPYDRSWFRGQVAEEWIYKHDNGNYQLVKKTVNNYQKIIPKTFNVGFFCFQNDYPMSTFQPPTLSHDDVTPIFQYNDILAETGLYKLMGTTDTLYTGTGKIAEVANYNYDHLDNQYEVSSITKKQSDGLVLKTDYTYPGDLQTVSVYNEMFKKNILNPIVTEVESINNKFTKSVSLEYSKWWSANIYALYAPISMKKKMGTLPFNEIDEYFNSYDTKGNLLTSVNSDHILSNYVWAYNQTLPIIKAENVDYNTLIQTIQSTLTIVGLTDIESLVQDIGDLKTSLQQGRLNSFNSILRDKLPTAMITTYTYLPLVGMTSQTDPRSVTTYYYYDANDAYGRLQYIKDTNNKLVKKIEYNYKQQIQ